MFIVVRSLKHSLPYTTEMHYVRQREREREGEKEGERERGRGTERRRRNSKALKLMKMKELKLVKLMLTVNATQKKGNKSIYLTKFVQCNLKRGN